MKITAENTVPKAMLRKLSSFISVRIGLYFPEDRWNTLQEKLQPACREFGFRDIGLFAEWLLSTPLETSHLEKLAAYLTIGETYFFRNINTYEELEKKVLPELINSRRKSSKSIRIWSAGCSSGEEPYSLAILLHKMIPDIKDWKITIMATDINLKALAKASAGVYGKWSFRKTPQWIKDGYFRKTKGNSLELLTHIKKMVKFFFHNLAEDPFPSLIHDLTSFDIIFCRNVLMYFQPHLAKEITDQLNYSLLNGGWLVVGGSEGYSVSRSNFVTVSFTDAIMYRKDHLNRGIVEFRDKELQVATPQPVPGFSKNKPAEVISTGIKKVKPVTDDSEKKILKKKKLLKPAYEKALELFEQGRYMEAGDILTGLIMKEPGNGEATKLLVKTCSNQGKFKEAIKLCEKNIEVNKFDPVMHYLLALILREQNITEKVVMELNRTIYLDPDFVLAYYTLGNIFFRNGSAKKAEKFYDNALSILDFMKEDEILPEADGLTAGRLSEIISAKKVKTDTP